MTRWWRLGHRWLGVFAAAVLFVSATTGWLMMHDDWMQGKDFSAIAADPHNGHHLLAASPQGLWRSTNDGATWQPVTMPVPTAHVTAVAAGTGGFAVALRDFGVWTSPDGYIWDRVLDAPENEWIVSLSFQDGKLAYLTSDALIVNGKRTAQQKSTLRQLHDWHTGWALGKTGNRLIEAGAISLIILTISGLTLFWRTRRRRRPAQPPQTPSSPATPASLTPAP